MKKLIALLLVAVICLAVMTACTTDAPAEDANNDAAVDTPVTDAAQDDSDSSGVTATDDDPAPTLDLTKLHSEIAAKSDVQEGTSFTPRAIDDGTIDVAYVCSYLGAQGFTDSYNKITEAFEGTNCTITLLGPSDLENRTEEELQIVEGCISSGDYDVIFIYADDFSPFVPLRLQAEEKGIAFVCFLLGADSNMGTIYYGDTPELKAEANANSIIEYVDANPDLYKDFDKIQVAVADNSSNEIIHIQCYHTAEILEADGRFEMVYMQDANGAEEGITFAENVMLAHPDVRIFIGNCDDAASGINEGLISAGHGDDAAYIVTGVDGTEIFKQACEAGQPFRFSTAPHYGETGEDLLQILPALMNGEIAYGTQFLQKSFQIKADTLTDYFG